MGKLSRTKGAKEELRVAKLYLDVLGTDVKRELAQTQYIEGLGRDLRGTSPYCIQVKCGKTISPKAALREAISALDISYTIPVVHARLDGDKSMVFLREEDWMRIVKQLKEAA